MERGRGPDAHHLPVKTATNTRQRDALSVTLSSYNFILTSKNFRFDWICFDLTERARPT